MCIAQSYEQATIWTINLCVKETPTFWHLSIFSSPVSAVCSADRMYLFSVLSKARSLRQEMDKIFSHCKMLPSSYAQKGHQQHNSISTSIYRPFHYAPQRQRYNSQCKWIVNEFCTHLHTGPELSLVEQVGTAIFVFQHTKNKNQKQILISHHALWYRKNRLKSVSAIYNSLFGIKWKEDIFIQSPPGPQNNSFQKLLTEGKGNKSKCN